MSIKKLPEDIKEVFNEVDDILKNYPDVKEIYDVDVDEDGPFIVPMDNKPIFCSEMPSFMGGAFNDDDTNKEVKSQAARLSKEINGNPKILEKSFVTCYLHGGIEYLCGFDIPNLIDGTIPELQYGNIVDCLVYDYDDIVHECFMVIGKRLLAGNGLFCLIVLKEEIDNLQSTREVDVSFLNNDSDEEE